VCQPYVLIADDNRDLAKGLSLLLKPAGFAVEIVHDGNDALRSARTRRPDIVILDIGLPGLDGFQVAEQMRRDEGLKNILLIAISGYGLDTFPERSRQADFDHRFVKPVGIEDLLPLMDCNMTMRSCRARN
jgi:CheY-like chemotaxis protein